MQHPLTVAVLAGGKSSRMGVDKSFVRVLGRPLIEDILAQVAGIGAETILITNRPDDYRYLGAPLFADVLPDKGALGGIYTALYHSSQPHTLCLACDMPFVVYPLLDYLISLIPTGDAIVPRLAGEAEPFRAIYAHACLGPIRAALEGGKMRVISFFPGVRVRFVDEPEIDHFDPQRLSFFNVNTPEDLEQARRLATTQ
ncbi:MAG TPA: molybdenum cofactor guanylyltransferase [Anaerolineales bacterium]|nr:molybdenum cofactor guanylyltransferase [Anaerolineales bacterium]